VALGSVILFVALAVIRLSYPYELEWIEGAYVDQVNWIVQGHALYREPTTAFIPLNKTPLYFYLAAPVMRLLGAGFAAPRLVSVLATLGCFLLLFQLAAEETGRPLPGVVAAGLTTLLSLRGIAVR
jgi:4-amino-4-deoxy-L-arabinose transferase-like glycosyltransferase